MLFVNPVKLNVQQNFGLFRGNMFIINIYFMLLGDWGRQRCRYTALLTNITTSGAQEPPCSNRAVTFPTVFSGNVGMTTDW